MSDADDPSLKSKDYQIRIRGLDKAFGAHKVLRGVDLDIERGHINVVIGGSGQGKSVLMKHLMGLLKPDAGHIWVDGEDVVPMNDVQLNKLRRKFGMAFQYAALFDSLTVEQNVAFPLVEHTKKSKAEIHELVIKRLNSLGLRNVEKKMPAQLSGGMRKRAGLARAMALDPSILLVDEPSAGLDPITSDEIDRLLLRAKVEEGKTLVVVTHNIPSARTLGDELALLDRGRLVVRGTAADLERSDNPLAREFMQAQGGG